MISTTQLSGSRTLPEASVEELDQVPHAIMGPAGWGFTGIDFPEGKTRGNADFDLETLLFSRDSGLPIYIHNHVDPLMVMGVSSGTPPVHHELVESICEQQSTFFSSDPVEKQAQIHQLAEETRRETNLLALNLVEQGVIVVRLPSQFMLSLGDSELEQSTPSWMQPERDLLVQPIDSAFPRDPHLAFGDVLFSLPTAETQRYFDAHAGQLLYRHAEKIHRFPHFSHPCSGREDREKLVIEGGDIVSSSQSRFQGKPTVFVGVGGTRTNSLGAEYLREQIGHFANVIELELIKDVVLHLDCALKEGASGPKKSGCSIQNGLPGLVIYPFAFKRVIERLHELGTSVDPLKLTPLEERELFTRFETPLTNVLEDLVGKNGKDVAMHIIFGDEQEQLASNYITRCPNSIILPRENEGVRRFYEEKGVDVHVSDLSNLIVGGGGGINCATLDLFRLPNEYQDDRDRIYEHMLHMLAGTGLEFMFINPYSGRQSDLSIVRNGKRVPDPYKYLGLD